MSTTKKESKAVETKRIILLAAQALFAEKGYDHVTMREIARKAGCSHTAIYMYYKDKESLLEQIALPPLKKLLKEFQQLTSPENKPPLEILQKQCRLFVEFGLENQHLYPVYFTIKAERVDVDEPKLEINRIRNTLFQVLNHSVHKALYFENLDGHNPVSINYGRIIFYQLHGMIMTYTHSNEPMEDIKKRVLPLVDQGVKALIRGLQE